MANQPNIGFFDGVAYDQNSQINKTQENVLYVGKHGSNDNDGRSFDRALLTFTYALTLATSGTSIVCLDNGSYSENLTMVIGVDIDAKNATLIGTITVVDDSNVEFGKMEIATGTTGISGGTMQDSYVKIRYVVASGTGVVFDIGGGFLVANMEYVFISSGSIISATSNGTLLANIKYISIDGIGGTVINLLTDSNVQIQSEYIIDTGVGDDAGVLFKGTPAGACKASVITNYLKIGVLSNINANATCDLLVLNTAGTLAENGVGLVDLKPFGAARANGLATLDSTTHVPIAQLPPAIMGGMTYKGTWDCSSGAYPVGPTTSDYYICSVAGTISGTAYTVGDYLIYNGASWDKVDFANIYLQIDQTVPQTTTGTFTFPDVSVTNDLDVGRDITATRDITALEDLISMRDTYLHRDTYFGQGYGSGGSMGYAGVIQQDGSACWQGNHNFIAGGIRIMEDAPATPTAIGAKGELTYGTDATDGFDYIYIAKDDLDWKRVNVTPLGDEQVSIAAANDFTITSHNVYVTGATQINRISAGLGNSILTLIFAGAPLIKYNQASGGGFYAIKLAGSGDFQTAAGNSISFRWDAVNSVWVELSRMVL